MPDTTQFRCYYDDGTILTNAEFCPDFNEQGSPLIFSEYSLITTHEETIEFPWLLLIFGMIVLTSDERN